MQDGHPVAFASRALTDAETRYAQIEKELLAIVFACNKFSNLIYGRHTLIHSDHKPLEQIFKKSISQTTPRLQRMLLCLLKFDLEVAYKPGKEMYVSDTLSRAYTTTTQTTAEIELAEEIDVTVHTLLHDTSRRDWKAWFRQLDIDAPAAAVHELERRQRINEDVMRFKTVRVEALDEEPSPILARRDREERRRARREGREGDESIGYDMGEEE